MENQFLRQANTDETIRIDTEQSSNPLLSALHEHWSNPRSDSQFFRILGEARTICDNLGLTDPDMDRVGEIVRRLLFIENSAHSTEVSTGYLNRAGVVELIKAARSKSIDTLYFVYFDMNFVKDINSLLGRETTGNACIYMMFDSNNLVATSFNGVVSRLGGDEGVTVFQTKEQRDAFVSAFTQVYQEIPFEDWLTGMLQGQQVIDKVTLEPAIPDLQALQRLQDEKPDLFATIYPPGVTMTSFELDLSGFPKDPTKFRREHFNLFFYLVNYADKESGEVKSKSVATLHPSVQEQLLRKSS
jgi:GGDEF domain-containing protein